MKYEVRGTIELNWAVVVEADDEDEAVELGKGYAFDGDGVVDATGEITVYDVIPLKAKAK